MFLGARWLAVAAVALLLAAAPQVTHALPVHQSDVSATRLAARIQDSASLAWSGEVRSRGSLQVPLTGSTFGGVARVLGEQTQLRVWWRDPDNWRLDRIRATGESDLVRDGGLTVRWNYEDNRVNFTPYSPIRLPDDVDVVPAALARRLLAGATPDELIRLRSQRVAGHVAAGLRLVPDDERSTISKVDVWAEEKSGLPLRVEVYGDPTESLPILDTEMVSVSLRTPGATRTDFRLSPSLDFSRGVALDEAAGANVFAPFDLPRSIADLPRRGAPETFGAVGVYGRGPTAVLAVPVRRSTAKGLHDQIAKSRDSQESGRSISLQIGPISILLVRGHRSSFLLAGTVSPATLRQAAIDLVHNIRRTR